MSASLVSPTLAPRERSISSTTSSSEICSKSSYQQPMTKSSRGLLRLIPEYVCSVRPHRAIRPARRPRPAPRPWRPAPRPNRRLGPRAGCLPSSPARPAGRDHRKHGHQRDVEHRCQPVEELEPVTLEPAGGTQGWDEIPPQPGQGLQTQVWLFQEVAQDVVAVELHQGIEVEQYRDVGEERELPEHRREHGVRDEPGNDRCEATEHEVGVGTSEAPGYPGPATLQPHVGGVHVGYGAEPVPPDPYAWDFPAEVFGGEGVPDLMN